MGSFHFPSQACQSLTFFLSKTKNEKIGATGGQWIELRDRVISFGFILGSLTYLFISRSSSLHGAISFNFILICVT
jgi:hypothetical protein